MNQAGETVGQIRVACAEDAAAITELRLAAYGAAREFSLVEAETIRWGRKDMENIVLGAWAQDGQLLSTTRGDALPDFDAAEDAMECSLVGCRVEFPALLLGKGATRKGYERHGLHSALRLHFLQAAMATKIRTVLGIVYADAPRVNLMSRIGYEFTESTRFWYTDLSPHRPTLIGILARERLPSACEYLKAEVSEAINDYPFVGRDLAARIDELPAMNGYRVGAPRGAVN
jgi:hypothetical protein